MKPLCGILFWFIGLPLIAQGAPTFEVSGFLRLTDKPPEATPVEALSFRIHPLAGGFDVPAQHDRDGRFLLRNGQPGRYSLTVPMLGRLDVFAIGSTALAPDDF